MLCYLTYLYNFIQHKETVMWYLFPTKKISAIRILTEKSYPKQSFGSLNWLIFNASDGALHTSCKTLFWKKCPIIDFLLYPVGKQLRNSAGDTACCNLEWTPLCIQKLASGKSQLYGEAKSAAKVSYSRSQCFRIQVGLAIFKYALKFEFPLNLNSHLIGGSLNYVISPQY